MKDQLLRQMAETENVRKMGKAQIEDSKLFGMSKFVQNLLSVVDTFELAMEKCNLDSAEAALELKRFHEAVGMAKKDILKVFEQHEVKVFGAHGENPFSGCGKK